MFRVRGRVSFSKRFLQFLPFSTCSDIRFQMQRALGEVFRSHNRGKIAALSLSLGATPHSSKEQFVISWPLDCSSAGAECLCLDGRPVSDREYNHVFSVLFGRLSSLPKSKLVGGDKRAFLWILARDSAKTQGFLRDPGFQLPPPGLAEARRLKRFYITARHSKPCLSSATNSSASGGLNNGYFV